MGKKQKTKFKKTEIGMIPGDWEIKSIDKLCEVKSGKRLPKGHSLVETKTQHQYIRVRDLSKRSVKVNELLFITDETFEKISKYIIKQDDVYISIVGTIGLVGIIPSVIDGANLTENCARLTHIKSTNNKWISYYLNSNSGQEQIRSYTVGSTQGKLALFRIKKIKIPFPSLNEQKKIVKILSDLDSKIELLQNQNQTLEKIGKTIFKHWFVDFEFPNEKGEPYKSSGGKMIDSELGKIPEGWKVGKYEELVSVFTGRGLKKSESAVSGKYPVLGANGELGRADEFLYDEPLILTGRVGTLGTVYRVDKKVWISDNVLISKPHRMENYFYSYYVIRRFDLKSLDRGSTQPLITQTDLKNQTVLIPPNDYLVLFDKIGLSVFKRFSVNDKLINILKDTKDSLLPKLMSGKIRVPVK